MHTLWTWVHIQALWTKLVSKLYLIFKKELDLDPECLLLGLPCSQIRDFKSFKAGLYNRETLFL